MLQLLTDSMVARNTILNLCKGDPPRSGIEQRIKNALVQRQHQDTAVSWVRAHIGIPGNEAADKEAEFQSYLGEIARPRHIVTPEGLRAAGKRIRMEARAQTGLGNRRRPLWNGYALSAYTWMWSNKFKGPQRQWLHQIRKAETPLCPCGALQSGDHIVFSCPIHRTARQALLGDTNHTWETLDTDLDSMAAKATAINLANGAAPRPHIEQEIKAALNKEC